MQFAHEVVLKKSSFVRSKLERFKAIDQGIAETRIPKIDLPRATKSGSLVVSVWLQAKNDKSLLQYIDIILDRL
jgi:hypothetical protein